MKRRPIFTRLISVVLITASLLTFAAFSYAETDVTSKVQIIKSALTYDRRALTSSLNFSVKNISQAVLLTPIKVVIESISGTNVYVSNPDGYTMEGKPYFQYTTTSGQLLFNQTSSAKKWIFGNPNAARFSYITKTLGIANEATATIGTEGGTISSPSGIAVTIPIGALNENTPVYISRSDQSTLTIEPYSTGGLEVLGAMNLDLGNAILNSNAEITFPKPLDIDIHSRLFLGKLVHVGINYHIIPVDNVYIEGDQLISSDPPFPGPISSGIYATYKYNTDCGITDLANYFQIDANCSQKLDAHIFFKIASPHLETTSQGYLDIANGVYNIVKASQSALNIATNIASFNGISSLSGEELAVLGVTKSADFVAELTNNEYAQVWLPLGTCAIKAAILAPDISSCSALVTQSYNILTNFALTFSYLDASEKINTITVAHEYLYRLYSWGGSENFLANSYGLGGGASFEDVLKKVAQSFGFKDDTISYLAGKSYNWHMAQGIIQKAQTMMANFRQSFDKDNDGIYDGLQPVIDQSPLAGLPGTTFIQKGRLFTPFSTATLHFKKPDGSEYPISEIETDNKGRFEISYAAPSDKSPGNYTWWAIDDTSGRKSNEISYEISKLPASMPALEYNVPFLYSGYTYTDYYISELSPDLSYAYNNENYSYMATYYANRIQPQPEYDLFQGDIRGIGLACFTGYSTPPAGPSGTFCLQGDNEGYAPHFSRCYNRYAEQWEPCPNVYRGFLPPSKPLSESTRTTFPLHIMNYLPNDFQGDYGLGVVQWGQKVLDPNY